MTLPLFVFTTARQAFLANLNAQMREEKGQDRERRWNNSHIGFRRTHRHPVDDNRLSVGCSVNTIVPVTAMIVLILRTLISAAMVVSLSI